MRTKKHVSSAEIQPNLTPMIDVVFNLLIFFVVTIQFSELDMEAGVMLPSSTAAEQKDYTDFRNVVVNIVNPDNPTFMVMHRAFTMQELTEYLKECRQAATDQNQSLNLILRADKEIPYDEVARVMLCGCNAEIQTWWIQTDVSDRLAANAVVP